MRAPITLSAAPTSYPALDTDSAVFFHSGGHHIRQYGSDYAPLYLCEESRRDEAGNRWSRTASAVVDDFGDLVEVTS